LEKSIKDEKEGKKRNEMLTGLAGAGLTIGSFFVPVAGEVSMLAKAGQVMRVLGAGLSLYSASSALPDLMMLDKATQAQRGGAGKLTPQSEGEAKFNLYMGYTNLVLAGVDAGAHKLAFNVAKSVGSKGLQALSKLDRAALAKLLLNARALRAGTSPEMVQVMDSLRQATGNDKKLYEQLLDAFKNAKDKFPPSGGGSPQLATEGVGGNAGQVTEELGKKNQPLRSQGKENGLPTNATPAPKGLVKLVEEEPSGGGRWFARYDADGKETFSVRMANKTNEAEIAWIDPLGQLPDNLAAAQAATGKNIPKISGNASDGFEIRLRKLFYSKDPTALSRSGELYSRILEKKLGGKWRVDITLKKGTGTNPIENAPEFKVEANRIGE
jgi:hypothetical protein